MMLVVALGGALGLLWVATSRTRSAFVLTAAVITNASAVSESDLGVQGFILPLALAILFSSLLRWLAAGDRANALDPTPEVALTGLAIAGIGVSLALGGFVAENPTTSYNATVEVVKNGLVAAALASVATRREGFRAALFGIMVGGGILATITTWQLLTGGEANDWFGFGNWSLQVLAGTGETLRSAGPFEDPNSYAQYTAVVVGVAGAFALGRLNRMTTRVAAVGVTVMGVVAIAATASRTGALALLAVGLLLAVLTNSLKKAAVGGAVLIVVATSFGAGDVGSRLGTLSEAVAAIDDDTDLADRSVRGRSSEMVAAWQMFLDHPITGVGYGGYNDRYLEYSRDIGLDDRLEDRSAHSLPLEIAAEQGVVGILAWGLLFVLIGRSAVKLHHREPALGSAFGGALVGFGVSALFLHDVHPRLLFSLFGLGVAASLVANRASPTTPTKEPGVTRVAMVIQNYLPSVGGAERQLATLVPRLRARSVEAIVITRGRDGLPGDDVVAGGRVIRVPVRGPKLLRSAMFVIGATQQIRALDVDAVVAFDSLTPSTIGRRLDRSDGLRYATKILRSGQLGDLQRLERKPFGRRRLRHLTESASAFITISSEINDELLLRGVVAHRRCSIPNGVDSARFAPSLEDRAGVRAELDLGTGPVVIMTGRVAAEKRVVEVASRWSTVRDRHPSAVLLVVGDGPLVRDLAGIEGVRSVGRREDVPRLLAASSVYLSASVAEGLSNSLLEAMSTGLPCVVTDVGGVRDVITSGVDGLVVPTLDIDAVIEALLGVLSDPPESLGLAARQRVEKSFGLNATSFRLAALCRDLAGARGPVAPATLGPPRTPVGTPR